jgi:hypothetical protein
MKYWRHHEYRQELKRRESYLPMIGYDIHALCAEIKRSRFPSHSLPPVLATFCENDTLACVCPTEHRIDIYIHLVLNFPSTPVQVFRLILTHELLHIVIPSEMVDGKVVHHTGAFRREEKRMCPEISQAWTWLWTNFGPCLRRDKKEEVTVVKRNWKQFYGPERPFSWRRCSETTGSDPG